MSWRRFYKALANILKVMLSKVMGHQLVSFNLSHSLNNRGISPRVFETNLVLETHLPWL
jgi:hypothetical protein